MRRINEPNEWVRGHIPDESGNPFLFSLSIWLLGQTDHCIAIK